VSEAIRSPLPWLQECGNCSALINLPEQVRRYCRSREMGTPLAFGQATLSSRTRPVCNHFAQFAEMTRTCVSGAGGRQGEGAPGRCRELRRAPRRLDVLRADVSEFPESETR
jgi:hypothetical protein